MHVVTKILVVFCAVLSLLLAALTMSYSANAAAIHNSYRQLELAKQAADANVRDLESSIGLIRENYEKRVQTADQELGSYRSQLASIQAERTRLLTQLEQAKAAAEGVANRISHLAASNETLAKMNASYRDEVTTLRDDTLAANRREIELTDRIRDLEGQREVLEQTARALREQLRETQLAAQNQSAAAPGADGSFEHVGKPIFARVLEVKELPGGAEFVTISEGENRDIKPNMKLNIIRGNEFLATMIVMNTDAQRATGRIDLKKGAIQPNDLVVSHLGP
ncbi:MAG: hypothetical protein AB7G11_03455 [Phycisphaerales bacterium]